MTHNNPFNLIPLHPTGRNDTDSANTYTPDDMIKIYEQQFLTEVAEDKLAEFLPMLKAFYDIDNNTLDICAIIFDAIGDSTIIYNHKVKAGDYEILGELIEEERVEDGYDNSVSTYDNSASTKEEGNEAAPAYTIECRRNFFINEVKLPYQFNLFIQGDSYSILTRDNNLLEQIYWLVNDGFEAHVFGDPDEQQSLESINEQLASLDIRAMDLTTVYELVNFIEDHLMDEDMMAALDKILDDAE